MPVIDYDITIGTTTYQSPGQALVQSVTVESALKVPVNAATITLTTEANTTATPGDPVTIKLGSDGTLETVFTGITQSVAFNISGITVYAYSSIATLAQLHIDAVYEQKNCSDIIKSLLGQAAVATGTIEDGLEFSRYIINKEKNAWRHAATLAAYSGVDWYVNEEDQACFVAYQQTTGMVYEYGKHILEIEKETIQPSVDGVVVYGESEGNGDETDSWFKKEAVSGAAGQSAGKVTSKAIYAARSQPLCDAIAQNLYAATQTKATGRLVALAGEKAKLGHTVTVHAVPGQSVNGNYKVTGIKHVMSATTGFRTTINWEEVI